MERKSGTAAVFMDCTKAFDKVWHSGLLFKLATLGVQKDSIEWIKDYLSCRYISVRVGSTLSDPHGISAGVPQGSHLGPILFLVFITDLTTVVQADIYADDILLHQDIDPTTALCDPPNSKMPSQLHLILQTLGKVPLVT